jgi:hypothetical protein
MTGTDGNRRRSVSTSRSAAAWRGRDDADPPRERRQAALARGFEQAGGRQCRLHLDEPLVQCAEPGKAHRLDVELEFAARVVDRRDGAHFHGQAFAQREAETLRLVAEEDAANLCRRVLEREVEVSRRSTCASRHFAADPREADLALEQHSRIGDEAGNGHDRGCARPRRRNPGEKITIARCIIVHGSASCSVVQMAWDGCDNPSILSRTITLARHAACIRYRRYATTAAWSRHGVPRLEQIAQVIETM